MALSVEADVLGINNRDLIDFSVDIERTYELLSDIPAGKTVVSESGYSRARRARRARARGRRRRADRRDADARRRRRGGLPRASAAAATSTLFRSRALIVGGSPLGIAYANAAARSADGRGPAGRRVTAAAMMAGGRSTGTIAASRGCSRSSRASSSPRSEIYDRAAPGVVAVRANSVQPSRQRVRGERGSSDFDVSTGSGFVLDGDGRIVTNAHVVSGVTAVQVTFADGDRRLGAGGRQGRGDRPRRAPGLARGARPAPARARRLERAADPATACWRSATRAASAPPPAPAASRASGRRIEVPGGYVIDDLLETDAVIEPASSGGPLLGTDGRVVGITARLEGDTPASPCRPTSPATCSHSSRRTTRSCGPYLGIRGRATGSGVELLALHPGGRPSAPACERRRGRGDRRAGGSNPRSSCTT